MEIAIRDRHYCNFLRHKKNTELNPVASNTTKTLVSITYSYHCQ